MSSIRVDTLSPFGRLAVTLDTDFFPELSRLSGQIQRLDLDTDGDLDHAVKLLNEIYALCAGDHRRQSSKFSQSFWKLKPARMRRLRAWPSEPQLIQQRKEHQAQIHGKLAQVNKR